MDLLSNQNLMIKLHDKKLITILWTIFLKNLYQCSTVV